MNIVNCKINRCALRELFFKYVPMFGIVLYLAAVAVFYALVTAYFPTQNGDNIEHIHSSFMVAIGQVPYRDFFQHHNPLLWYLFAPLTKLFAYDTTIAEVACLISLLVFLKSLVYVYRIVYELWGDKFWGFAAAAMVAAPGYKLYAIDLRPDNYMIFCLMGGLYYFIRYLKAGLGKDLTIAFIWFTVSFLFAQKALFPLFVLGLIGLWYWGQGKIKTADMRRALICPFVLLSVFLGYLIYYDMVKLYYDCNYTFNLALEQGFDRSRISDFPLKIKILIVLGWGGVIVSLFQKKSYLFYMIAVLFVSEFLQRVLYFSPYSYYYWLLVYLAVVCSVPFLMWLSRIFPVVGLAVVGAVGFMLWQTGTQYYAQFKAEQQSFYLPDYITRNISRCDYVFNGNGIMYNIFAKDPAYYWQLIGQLDVIGEKVGIRAKPDINMLIKTLKPKFVFGNNYFNKFADEKMRYEIVHYVDTALLDKYYVPIRNGSSVYQLRKEYDNRRCVFDDKSGQWKFDTELNKF